MLTTTTKMKRTDSLKNIYINFQFCIVQTAISGFAIERRSKKCERDSL